MGLSRLIYEKEALKSNSTLKVDEYKKQLTTLQSDVKELEKIIKQKKMLIRKL